VTYSLSYIVGCRHIQLNLDFTTDIYSVNCF